MIATTTGPALFSELYKSKKGIRIVSMSTGDSFAIAIHDPKTFSFKNRLEIDQPTFLHISANPNKPFIFSVNGNSYECQNVEELAEWLNEQNIVK